MKREYWPCPIRRENAAPAALPASSAPSVLCVVTAVLAVPLVVLAACGPQPDAELGGLSGTISLDGSSTVFPITEAVAEEFMYATRGSVRVTVALSGTGGGFRRFCVGDTDISNASRHITAGERDLCAQNGVEFVELMVAIDGLAVVVNPANDFAQCMTTAELRRIWEPGSNVQSWAQVRAGWPDQRMRLYAPGTASGTFDYFTEAVMGRAGASRADFTASEDDNVLVQGVEGDRGGLGYFGYAYYEENQGRLRLVAIDDGQGCIAPTPETVSGGEYMLARPLFIYVKRQALERPEVEAFVRFYLEDAPELVREVGYVPLSDAQYEQSRARFEEAIGARAGE
jgi:phosphate transport system substrate-binding protein